MDNTPKEHLLQYSCWRRTQILDPEPEYRFKFQKIFDGTAQFVSALNRL